MNILLKRPIRFNVSSGGTCQATGKKNIGGLHCSLVDLLPDQACDISVQHRLRECLHKHRHAHDECGVKVPVVATVSEGVNVRYVRLGHQFCVRDANAALNLLQEKDFKVRFSDSLLV